MIGTCTFSRNKVQIPIDAKLMYHPERLNYESAIK